MVTTTGHFATFGLFRNGVQICVVDGDNTNNHHDHDTITCGGVVQLKQGEYMLPFRHSRFYFRFFVLNPILSDLAILCKVGL